MSEKKIYPPFIPRFFYLSLFSSRICIFIIYAFSWSPSFVSPFRCLLSRASFFLLSRPFPYYFIISPSSAIPFDSFSLPPSSSCSPLASCAGRGRVLLPHTPTRKSTPVMAFRVVITDDGAEKLLITSSGQWLIANTIASPLVGLQVLAMNATCPIKGQKSVPCVCLSYNGRSLVDVMVDLKRSFRITRKSYAAMPLYLTLFTCDAILPLLCIASSPVDSYCFVSLFYHFSYSCSSPSAYILLY